MAKLETQRFNEIAPAKVQSTDTVQRQQGSVIQDLAKVADVALNNIAEKNIRTLQSDTKEQFRAEVSIPGQIAGQEQLAGRKLSALSSDREALSERLAFEIGGDIDKDDPRLQNAIKTFDRLATAQATGRFVPDHIKTIANSKLKQLINESPLLEKEIRKAAAGTLGFDPTGSDLAEAFGVFKRPGTEGATDQQKIELALRKQVALESGLILPVQDASAYQQGRQRIELEQENLKRAAATSESNFNAVSQLGSSQLGTLNDGVMKQVNDSIQAGTALSVDDSTLLASDYELKATQLMNSLLDNKSFALTDEAKRASLKANWAQEIKRTKEYITSGSMAQVLTNHNTFFEQAVIHGRNKLLPQIAVLHSVFGKDQTNDIVGKLEQAQGNKNMLSILADLDPAFAAFTDMEQALVAISSGMISFENGITPATGSAEAAAQKVGYKQLLDIGGDNTAERSTKARNQLGDGFTFDTFDSPKALTSTINQKSSMTPVFQNLYLDQAVKRTEELRKALSAVEGVTLKVSDLEKDAGRRRSYKYRGLEVVDTREGQRTDTSTSNLLQQVGEYNRLLRITKRYTEAGIKTGIGDIDSKPYDEVVKDLLTKINSGESLLVSNKEETK